MEFDNQGYERKPERLTAFFDGQKLICPVHEEGELERRGSLWQCDEGHLLLTPVIDETQF